MSCNCENKFPQAPKCGCYSFDECLPIPVENDSIFFNPPSFTGFDEANAAWSELIVNGCVTVPALKPNIEAVVSVDSQIEIVRTKLVMAPSYRDPSLGSIPVLNEEGKQTTGVKLIVEGLICSTIGYVAARADQTVHTFHGKIPFSAYIVMPANTPLTNTYNVTGYIEANMVKSACERNVCLCTTFILQPTLITVPTCDNGSCDISGITCGRPCLLRQNEPCNCDQPIIQGISSPEQIAVLLPSADTQLWTEIFVPEILNIPICKPDLQKILTVASKFEILCQKVIATPYSQTADDNTNQENLNTTGRKLLIEGILKQRITYVSCTEQESVHSAHFNVPVSTFIILPDDAMLTDKYQLCSVIEDIFACGLNERQIFKNTTLFIKATELTRN